MIVEVIFESPAIRRNFSYTMYFNKTTDLHYTLRVESTFRIPFQQDVMEARC